MFLLASCSLRYHIQLIDLSLSLHVLVYELSLSTAVLSPFFSRVSVVGESLKGTFRGDWLIASSCSDSQRRLIPKQGRILLPFEVRFFILTSHLIPLTTQSHPIAILDSDANEARQNTPPTPSRSSISNIQPWRVQSARVRTGALSYTLRNGVVLRSSMEHLHILLPVEVLGFGPWWPVGGWVSLRTIMTCHQLIFFETYQGVRGRHAYELGTCLVFLPSQSPVSLFFRRWHVRFHLAGLVTQVTE